MLTEELDIDRTVVLDMGSYSITAGDGFTTTTGAVIGVKHGGDLNITGTGPIDANGKTYAAIAMAPGNDANDIAPAKLTLTGGTLKGNHYGIFGSAATGHGNTEINITGGSVQSVYGNDNVAIFNPQRTARSPSAAVRLQAAPALKCVPVC